MADILSQEEIDALLSATCGDGCSEILEARISKLEQDVQGHEEAIVDIEEELDLRTEDESYEEYEIEIELPDNIFIDLALRAHKEDMKLNDYVIKILNESLK